MSLFDIAMVNRTHGWASGSPDLIVRTQDRWQSFELQESGVSIPFYEIFFWNEYKVWVVGSENIISSLFYQDFITYLGLHILFHTGNTLYAFYSLHL